MADHGVTPDGFTRPTYEEILENIEREQIATIDPTLEPSTDPVVGEMNRIFARKLDAGWAALQEVYEGFDKDKAGGALLATLGKLTGSKKRGATYSLVVLTCNFANSGVTLEAGVHYANVEDRPDLRWTPVDDFTSTSDGNADVVFRAEQTGPIVPMINTISIIATPVTGWTDVNNPSVATPGRNVETDDEFRARLDDETDKLGAARVAAIRTDLLRVPGVRSVRMFENRTGLRDTVTGLPPHSFEACIWAGEPLEAETADIAQAIWDSRAGGSESFGDVTGFAETGETGAEALVLVPFRLATVREVYLRFDVKAGEGWVGVDEFATIIATELNRRHDIGQRVVSERIQALVFDKDLALGVEDLVDFRLGFAASPTQDENLGIAMREIARFDTGAQLVVNVIA
jgi:hypothetical protein